MIWIWFVLFCILQGQTCTDVDEKSFGELEYNQEKHEKERRETILEIRDTEINYGRDLKILKEVCISCLFPFFLVLGETSENTKFLWNVQFTWEIHFFLEF